MVAGYPVQGQITTVFEDDFQGSSINADEWEVWDLIADAPCSGEGGTVAVSGGYCNFKNNGTFSSRTGITRKNAIDLSNKRTVCLLE